MSLRAHLLHGADYASLALVDVVALRPWGSEFFRLVAANAARHHRRALHRWLAQHRPPGTAIGSGA